MPRHVENGQAVAEFLKDRPEVESVTFSGLPGDKYYEIAKKYLPNGGCGVVSFVLKGGRPAAEKFMMNLKLAAIETHVADARTCCLNPATCTHRQMTEEQLEAPRRNGAHVLRPGGQAGSDRGSSPGAGSDLKYSRQGVPGQSDFRQKPLRGYGTPAVVHVK